MISEGEEERTKSFLISMAISSQCMRVL